MGPHEHGSCKKIKNAPPKNKKNPHTHTHNHHHCHNKTTVGEKKKNEVGANKRDLKKFSNWSLATAHCCCLLDLPLGVLGIGFKFYFVMWWRSSMQLRFSGVEHSQATIIVYFYQHYKWTWKWKGSGKCLMHIKKVFDRHRSMPIVPKINNYYKKMACFICVPHWDM